MSELNNFSGNGTAKFPTQEARQIAVNELLNKGYTQVYSEPLSPKTFMLLENPYPDALNPRYMIEYNSY